MSQSISSQHPAVVLRSHYVHVRALLAIMMVVVAILAATVVILATDNDTVSGSTSARPIAPAVAAPSLRADGGPEESTRGPFTGERGTPRLRPDGGPEESTRGPFATTGGR